VHYSNKRSFKGEEAIEFPFPYTERFHCGKVEDSSFVDQDNKFKVPYERKVIIAGRFKL
jgi:hypothetical protein